MISVIVPVYNVEKFISECIESLINQTYKDIEIILVNDGSTDNSGSICDKYAELDSRIKVLHINNCGVSSARNIGIKNASGEYIQFVDSDDFLEVDMCEKLVNTIESNDYEMAICGYKCVYKDRVINNRSLNKSIDKMADMELLFSRFNEDVGINPLWNKLYRKNRIKRYFNQGVSLGEDLIFNLDYMDCINKIIIIEDDLYNYRIGNNNSLTSKYRSDYFETALLLYKNLASFCDKYFSKSFDKSAINTTSLNNVFAAIRQLVYFSGMSKKEKYKKLKECIDDTNVRTLLKNINTKDVQIKIFKYLIQRKLYKSTYLFFKIKYYLIKFI